MVSDLSGFMLIRATSTWDYELWAPLHCSLRSRALKDVQFSIVVGSDRAAALDPLGAQRPGVRGAKAQDPLALRTLDRRGPL